MASLGITLTTVTATAVTQTKSKTNQFFPGICSAIKNNRVLQVNSSQIAIKDSNSQLMNYTLPADHGKQFFLTNH